MHRIAHVPGLLAAALLMAGVAGCSSGTGADLASTGSSTAQADAGSAQSGGGPAGGSAASGVNGTGQPGGNGSGSSSGRTDNGSGQSGDNGSGSSSGATDSGPGQSGDGSGQSQTDSSASNQRVPFPPKPDDDPFYHQPESLPDQPRGTIIKSRMVQFAPEGGAPMPNDAWQLKFISRDVNNNPIAAIATVVKPEVEPPGGSPLLAYQYAEDGLGIKCAPSHAVTGSTQNKISQEQGTSPLPGLEKGWTLVYPDHEGPNSAFAAGPLEGQITLDSIRAAENYKPLGLSHNTQVGMWGYSGGAIATAWAATLQASYAPGLNIVAIASGGTPADVVGIAKNADTNPVTNAAFFSLVLSAVEGANRSYPKLVTPLLNAKGRSAARSLANGCTGNTSDGSPRPSGHFADYVTVDNVFKVPQVLKIAKKISLPQPDSAPLADTFVYHSQIDELIPVAGANALVKGWCSQGSTIHYYKGDTGEHAAFGPSATPFVLAYLTGRFSANTVVVPPGTQTCN